MQYVIRQKSSPVSVSREILIEDRHGEQLFRVHGPVVRARDELHVDDAHGVHQALIKEPLLGDRKTYEIHRNDVRYADVTTVDTGNLLEGYDVVVHGKEPLRARGDLFQHEFTITGAGGVAAKVHRHNASTVEVETTAGQDDLLLLSSVIAISAMTDARVRAATRHH